MPLQQWPLVPPLLCCCLPRHLLCWCWDLLHRELLAANLLGLCCQGAAHLEVGALQHLLAGEVGHLKAVVVLLQGAGARPRQPPCSLGGCLIVLQKASVLAA